MNKKTGMSNFQIGILVLLAIFTFGVVGGIAFFIFNSMTGNSLSNVFSIPFSKGIVGKWEVVTEQGYGDLYEFFPDGTIDLGGMFPLDSKYSYPDQNHIKIEMESLAAIYEYTLSSDTLTLISNSTTRTLKRYVEIPVNAQSVSGSWKKSYPSQSTCFAGLGVSDLQGITFGADGNFSLQGGIDAQRLHYGITMSGMYAINGSRLHIVASGVGNNASATRMPSLFNYSPTPTPIPPLQLQGEVNCTVTASLTRLNFIDDLNQYTVFIRIEN